MGLDDELDPSSQPTVKYGTCKESLSGIFQYTYPKTGYHITMGMIQEQIEELLRRGWTIAAIGDELEYSRDSIERWRKGSNPSSQKVVALGLEDLLRRKRIPKKKRYTQKRNPTIHKDSGHG
jgi:hypothetical protein